MNNKSRLIVGLSSAIITIFLSFVAEAYIGGSMNWPGVGSIFAVAIMGFFIIWSNQTDNDKNNSDKKD
ncbi:MAG: hypothetical protein HFE78_01975 [Clostridiales bacterium]|nr:hypothetical protein [Clostridiales bacterium]